MAEEAALSTIRTDLRGLNPLHTAYSAQCDAVAIHSKGASDQRRRHLTLVALALGTFCIGTSEFASMGIIQLFSSDLGISVPEGTNAITAYATGVVIGAPLITLLAARLNRRTLLLALMALFAVGNLLSGFVGSLHWLMAARFLSGMPHGAYFGAGAVVASYIVGPGHSGKAFAVVMLGLTVATIFGSPLATFLGQTLGWRQTFMVVGLLSVCSFLAILAWVPKTKDLDGGPVMQELATLKRPSVWVAMLVAASGVSSVFAVYTFIGPMTTDAAHLGAGMVPVALGIFGLGMTTGNLVGGRLADRHPALGILVGFGSALPVLAALALGGEQKWVLLPCLFGVGATMMAAIPTIQVRMTRFAPEAPALMGAMNLAALNVANALGAWAGALVVERGYGLLSAAWAGFALTLFGLIIIGLRVLFGPKLKPSG